MLGISRSKFDALIKEGKLPKGRKRRGFKELIWYKDELISSKV
jgi:predicted DNA-binding transcriptional regulator AlpA